MNAARVSPQQHMHVDATAMSRRSGEQMVERQLAEKNNARHFTMKGRAFREAAVLSGG
jgi:hypothetical protein